MVSLQKGSDNLMKWSRQLRQVEVISTRARANLTTIKQTALISRLIMGKFFSRDICRRGMTQLAFRSSRPWIALETYLSRGASQGRPICDEKIQHGIPFRLLGIVSKSSALRRQPVKGLCPVVVGAEEDIRFATVAQLALQN